MPRILLLYIGCVLTLILCYPVKAAQPLPEWINWREIAEPLTMRSGAMIGVDQGVLIVAGGLDKSGRKDSFSDEVYALPLNDNGGSLWRQAGKLHLPTAYGAVVAVDGGILFMGGSGPDGAVAQVARIGWNADYRTVEVDTDWPQLPTTVSRASAVAHRGSVYLIGSKNELDMSPRFLSLRITGNEQTISSATWQEVDTGPVSVLHHPILVAQGAAERDALFLFDTSHKSTAYRYDPGVKQWSTLSPPPVGFTAATAVPVGAAHILLFGSSQEDSHTVAYAYHTITNTWAEISHGTEIKGPVAAVELSDSILLVHREDAGYRVSVGDVQSAASHFKAFDYVTLTAYLMVIVGVGLYFSKRGQTTNDYFLAGNRIPWWAAGISLLATQVSSIGFMAVPAKTFATNWAYFTGVLTWFIVVPVVTRFYIPHFRKFKVASAYSYLELRFNTTTRLFAALSFSLMQIGRLAVVLLLPALALATITDLSLSVCIVLMGVIATLYTVTGGMAAVVWTDVVQACLLMSGALVAVVVVFFSLDDGVSQFMGVVAEDHKMRIMLPTMDIGAAAIWVVLVGNIFSRLSGLTSDQTVIQRYLTTPDTKSAGRALWLDVFASVPWACLVFLLGTALYVFYKTHPAMLHPAVDINGVVPLFIAQTFPPGLTGLLIAAIFAAAMSSLDSSMHSTATVLVSDIYIRFIPGSTERSRVWMAKLIVFVLGVFGTLMAIYLAQSGIKSIWDTFIWIVGLFVGVLAGLFMLGIFTKRTDGWDVLGGAVTGAAGTFYVSQYTRISFFLYPVVSIVICVTVALVMSYIPRRRRINYSYTMYAEQDL